MTDRAHYSAKAMINEWYAGDLRADTATIAEVLRGGGYATYAVGKWHVTKDIEEEASTTQLAAAARDSIATTA